MSDQEIETEPTEEAPSIEELAAQFEQSQPDQREQGTYAQPQAEYQQQQGGEYDQSEIIESLRAINERFSLQDQKDAELALRQDIDAAVTTVSEQLTDVKPSIIKGVLNAEYLDNPSFAKAWDKRQSNPEAFKKVLGWVANKYKSEFVTTRDPDVEANNQAANDLMKSVSGGSKSNDALNLPENEFKAYWDRLRAGG